MLKSLFRKIRLRVIQWRCGKNLLSLDFRDGVCILAPHPDDETMGCGQLIAEICKRGEYCRVFIISDGGCAHHNCCQVAEAAIVEGRKASCRKAMAALGLPQENLSFLDFPDGELSKHEEEIYHTLLQELEDSKYALFVPHELEGWSDHLAIHRIGKRIATTTNCHLFSYCVWFYYSMPFRKFSQVRWSSARILHATETLARKRKALEVYRHDTALCGKPYAGVLPDLLWQAVNDEWEIFFAE